MTSALQAVQAPVVGLVLLVACVAKLVRVLHSRSMLVVLDATALFPAALRRPATMVVCGCELSLGAGLILTTGRFAPAWWATGIRAATAVFFLVGACALVQVRERTPHLGCGCFGDLSTRPVSLRSIARTGMLAGAALASVAAPPLRLPPPGHAALAGAGIIAAELLLFAAVSPETREALLRLGYSEPCELRAAEPDRGLAVLRRSRVWRHHSTMLTSDVPEDTWREMCWWFAVYPANDGDRERRVVFAVEVKPHRPTILAAVTDPMTEKQSLPLSNAL